MRTTRMSSPLIPLDGMIARRRALSLHDMLAHSSVDSHGRLLVSMIDTLAIARLDADAELLMVEFTDGSSQALCIADVVKHDDVFIQLWVRERVGFGGEEWFARLWVSGSASASTVSSIRATSFAAFVGLE